MKSVYEIVTNTHSIPSVILKRDVILDFYFSKNNESTNEVSLLLINDGQDLVTMNFNELFSELYEQERMSPLLCVGIHCGEDRKNEYGTEGILNYKGQGAKAGLYSRFIFEELLPFTNQMQPGISCKSFCGFSLGGLSALNIVWNHAEQFSKVGVFSGSLWWRTLSHDDPTFVEADHRIMHNEIRKGNYFPDLKFFFETGTLDETADRNHNGIIDSIDDTISLIDELVKKGYDREKDIRYLELLDGKHDITTWRRAFPDFLKWGWGCQ